MTDLNIERIHLQISKGSGEEHRIQGITAMAMAMIGEELVELGKSAHGSNSLRIDSLASLPVSVDLQQSDDATCARAMAMSVMQAIRLRVEG
jgi:hypothetical protein